MTQQSICSSQTVFDSVQYASHQKLSLVSIFVTWMQRSRQRRALSKLDDRLLVDIGVTRKQAKIESQKPFWRA